MKAKPVIRLAGGKWDWTPRFGAGGSDQAANVAACIWCVNRNIKEGRYL